MARYMTLPIGTRLDLDEEIELSDGTRIKLGAARKEQLDDHLAVLLRRRTDQRIEAGLTQRIADMMYRSGAVITADLNESAACDDLDRGVLRILTEIIDEPVVMNSLTFVPRLTAEQYERCARELAGPTVSTPEAPGRGAAVIPRVLMWGGLLIVAGAAAVLSFDALRDLAAMCGSPPRWRRCCR